MHNNPLLLSTSICQPVDSLSHTNFTTYTRNVMNSRENHYFLVVTVQNIFSASLSLYFIFEQIELMKKVFFIIHFHFSYTKESRAKCRGILKYCKMRTHHADENFCVQQPKTIHIFFSRNSIVCTQRENYIIKKVQVEGKFLCDIIFSCMRRIKR